MARVTTEDRVTSVPNRFQLVIYSCARARDLTSGSEPNVSKDDDKNTVIALREIAEKKVEADCLKRPNNVEIRLSSVVALLNIKATTLGSRATFLFIALSRKPNEN